MNRTQVSLILAATAALLSSHPGRTAESTPEPPLLSPVPNPATWTIEVEYSTHRKSSSSKASATTRKLKDIYPLLVREVVQLAGENWHRVRFFDNDTQENVWIFNGSVVFQFPNFPSDKVEIVLVSDPISPAKGGHGPDFSEWSWIRPEKFLKTVKYRGQQCHYYEDKEASPLSGADPLNPVAAKGRRAWINAESRLPVAVADEAVTKTLTFAKSPSANIKLTGIFFTAYDKSVRRTNSQPNESLLPSSPVQ